MESCDTLGGTPTYLPSLGFIDVVYVAVCAWMKNANHVFCQKSGGATTSRVATNWVATSRVATCLSQPHKRKELKTWLIWLAQIVAVKETYLIRLCSLTQAIIAIFRTRISQTLSLYSKKRSIFTWRNIRRGVIRLCHSRRCGEAVCCVLGSSTNWTQQVWDLLDNSRSIWTMLKPKKKLKKKRTCTKETYQAFLRKSLPEEQLKITQTKEKFFPSQLYKLWKYYR